MRRETDPKYDLNADKMKPVFGFTKLLLEAPLGMCFAKYENVLEMLLLFSSEIQCVQEISKPCIEISI